MLTALSDSRHLRMMQEIAAAGDLSCKQGAHHFDLAQQTMSHHSKILKDAGILRCRETGQCRFISIDRDVIQEIAGMLPAGAGTVRKRHRS